MNKNLSSADRAIRLILAAFAAVLYLTNTVTGTWGAVVLLLAVILTLTSLVNFCPLYRVFGISTNRKLETESVKTT